MVTINGHDYKNLSSQHPDRKYIVVAFWGVETERKFFASRRGAMLFADRAAGLGADVHVGRIAAERTNDDLNARAAKAGGK